MDILLYIVVGVIIFFVTMQVFVRLKMRAQKGKPAPELAGKAGKHIKKGQKAIFYFFSHSCGACKPMTPIFDRLSKKEKSIFMVNIADDMETARAFGIMGTPSVVVVENGVISEFLVGQVPEAGIYDLL